jgi:hypothetical protein
MLPELLNPRFDSSKFEKIVYTKILTSTLPFTGAQSRAALNSIFMVCLINEPTSLSARFSPSDDLASDYDIYSINSDCSSDSEEKGKSLDPRLSAHRRVVQRELQSPYCSWREKSLQNSCLLQILLQTTEIHLLRLKLLLNIASCSSYLPSRSLAQFYVHINLMIFLNFWLVIGIIVTRGVSFAYLSVCLLPNWSAFMVLTQSLAFLCIRTSVQGWSADFLNGLRSHRWRLPVISCHAVL